MKENTKDTKTVLVLGTFDGIHRGHAELISTAKRLSFGGKTVELFTFADNPKAVLSGHKVGQLMTAEEKEKRALALGVDKVTSQRFTREFAAMSATDFFRYLTEKRSVAHIVVGYDYTFGCGGKGNVNLLKSLAEQAGIGLTVIMPVTDENNTVISSTAIRQAVAEGDMQRAEAMLGVPYQVTGTVVAGNKLGRTMGFPTANVAVAEEKLLPHNGVYATLCFLDGQAYPSVTNVGTAPTVRTELTPWVECHLLGRNEDLYGKTVTVAFVRKLRDEMKFDTREQLRKRVETDKELAKAVLDLRRIKSES